MDTAKVFINGGSQAIRLPRKYRVEGDMVGVKRIGNIIMLYPLDSAWDNFMASPRISEDVEEAIYSVRKEDPPSQRQPL